jgi:hypothetical protein
VTVQLQLLNAPQSQPPPVAPKGERNPPRAPQQLDQTPPEPAPPTTPPDSFELAAGVGPFVAIGWSPRASAGGKFALLGRTDAISTELAFELSLPTRQKRQDGSGFEVSAAAGSLSPCLRLSPVEACSVVRVVRIQVRGFGVDQPRSPSGWVTQGGVRLVVAQEIAGSLELRAHGQVVGTLSAWRVQLNETDRFRSPAAAFLLGIDVVALFL